MSGDDETPFLELQELCKGFGGEPVLRGIDLRVERGEVLTILGGSGSGKSVMLKHMIGLLQADSGRLCLEGEDVTRLSESEWVERRQRFGYVFQGAALFDSLSVFENVAFPIREHRHLDREELAARVAECLEAVGLEGIEDQLPAELSGGMRKRVGVARAIALEPAAILYDEPTTGLDPANSRRIGQLIVDLRERLGATSVVVTHDLQLCFDISDRVALLADGRIVCADAPDRFERSGHPRVEAFLAGFHSHRDDAPDAEPARAGRAGGGAGGRGGGGGESGLQ